MHIVSAQGIDNIPGSEWNRLAGTDYPFLRHEFLHALEASDSVGANSGWAPCHQLLYADEQAASLLAVMPLYLKDHSWGEYVFDWSWADAYHRHGLDYYPKLLSAIPFTPATGPRLAMDTAANPGQVRSALLDTIRQLGVKLGGSSWHLLFTDQATDSWLEQSRLLRRTGVQYHWKNRGYRDFADFLDAMVSRKRKSIRRERQRVFDHGLQLKRLHGDEISPALWTRFYRFYQRTYARRSGHGGYLTREFFAMLGKSMPEQILLVVAEQDGKIVAAALNFRGKDTLYGRYWGCDTDYSHLHFEACYYQGIEYCIEQGLQRFDAGAQGEHKIQRGFEAVATHSWHDIVHPAFRRAITDFVREEERSVTTWITEARKQLPFK